MPRMFVPSSFGFRTALPCLFLLALANCAGSTGGSDNNGGGGGDNSGTGGTRVTPPDPKPGAVAPTSLVRRLSQAELDNTLEDVLGDTTQPAQRFLVEDEFRPYDNDYTVQAPSRAFTEAMRELSRDVAGRAIADLPRRAKLVTCQPQGAGDAACFRSTVAALGRRLLRRPLATAEVDAYLPLLAFATENNPLIARDFFTAVELALRAFLQDPEFLNRVEIGRETSTPRVYALDSFEIGARLSYLLWGSAPDTDLLDQAEDDGLVTGSGRGAAFDRMMSQPRARSQLRRFHAQWLGYRAIPHPAATAAMFNQETSKLIDTVVFDAPAPYFDLFTSKRTYLTTELATHYGLPAPAGGGGWVDYPATSGRAGILSHGSLLAAFSKFSDTSPTQRGILVQTRLLCHTIDSPPANVNVDQPPGNAEADCKTDRYLAHMDQSGCRECHSQMDPIGLGLEHFDIAGKRRASDNGKPQCLLNGQGELPGIGPFSGPKELAEKLVDAGDLPDCVVRQYLTFAFGRPLETSEDQLAEGFAKGMAGDGNQLVALLRKVVTDPSFALRTLPEVP